VGNVGLRAANWLPALDSRPERLQGRAAADRLQTRPDGYRLDLGPDDLDLTQARAGTELDSRARWGGREADRAVVAVRGSGVAVLAADPPDWLAEQPRTLRVPLPGNRDDVVPVVDLGQADAPVASGGRAEGFSATCWSVGPRRNSITPTRPTDAGHRACSVAIRSRTP
jgi:hypothetical protein